MVSGKKITGKKRKEKILTEKNNTLFHVIVLLDS